MSYNNMSGLGSVGSIAASALNAFGQGMNAISHNVANVSTAGFDPVKVSYENINNNMGVTARVEVGSSIESNENLNNTESFLPPEILNPSGTDIPSSFVDMIATENAFEANAVTIKVWDSMMGALIDTKV